MENAAFKIPTIKNEKDLKKYIPPMYVINDYMDSYEHYTLFQNEILNLVKAGFEKRKCREYPVHFMFYGDDKKSYTLPLNNFLTNVYLWYGFVELYGIKVLNERFVITHEMMFEVIPHINNYLNLIGRELSIHNVRQTVINYNMSQILYNLRSISIDFALVMNLNFGIETFIHMYMKNPRIREIMETQFDPSMQPTEIEATLAKLQAEEIAIYKSDKENPLGVILSSGTGIKHKQLTEFTIAQGLKPDLIGRTITLPISGSTILRGLENPSDLYIDAGAARKSLVSNHNVMGKAGYFGKIVLLLVRSLSLSKSVLDCGTKHLVKYHISKGLLKKMNGKYYKMDPDDEDYMLLDGENDKHLIGMDIYVRSAATCALGDQVCARCFGKTANLNWDIADGIGGFESEEVTKVVNQSILSTKHLLTTNSETVEFNPEFYKFFNIYGGDIMPIVNDNLQIRDIEDWGISIDPNNMAKLEEYDDDSFNTFIINGEFDVYNFKTGEVIHMKPKNEKEIFLSDATLDLLRKKKNRLNFEDMDDDMRLFSMDIYNNELTRPLYELMNLRNKEKKDLVELSIDSMSQRFADLLVESGIGASVIAAELIINRLIRSSENKYDRPDFTKYDLELYQIYTVSKALRCNRSPLIGICYQNIKQQLLDPDTVNLKDGTSYVDAYFKEKVPTHKLTHPAKIRPVRK